MKSVLGIWKKAAAVTLSMLLVAASVNVPGLVLGVQAAQEKAGGSHAAAFSAADSEVATPSNMPRGEERGGKPENTDHGASGEDAADLWEDAAPDGTEDAANADGMDAVPGDPLADNIVVSEALDQSLLKAAGVKTATPSDMEKESVVKILDMPAFAASKVVDGVRITVTAEEGTFPEGAVLVAEKVPTAKEREAEAAVAEQRTDGQTVAVSYTFDIRVEDAEGNELQPEDGHAVQVSFSTSEIADGNLETNVYHITEEGGSASADSEAVVSEAGETAEAGNENENAGGTDDTDASAGTLTAEKLEVTVDESTETAVAETDGFSLYTVEFTYNSLQYVMPGGTEVRLAEILNTVGLSGEATAVEVSNASLFSASNGSGEWVITSHEPFSSTEWMKVTINGIVYEITVTDANVNVNVNSWAGLQAAFTADNNVALTADVTAAASDERLSIPAGVNITLDLNGYTINRTQQESNGHVISLYGKLTLKDSSSGQTGKITGGNNYSSQGGAIVVFDGGKLIMESGMISGNEATKLNNAGQGGGVCVMSGGSFTMSGGSITENIAGTGGGVYVASGAAFTMSGGSISNNRTDRSNSLGSYGGGVAVAGTFTMSGGTISGNTAGTFGGGIEMRPGGDFNMSGGSITDNTASSSGGGIAGNSEATITIKGGSITNNRCSFVGGGITARGTFNLQGNPTISGNKSGSYDSNLYAATTIHITGELTNSTRIGVTTETTPGLDGFCFTSGLQSPGNADYTKFKSDSEKYYMGEYTSGSGKEAILYANYEIYVNCTNNYYSRFTPETPYIQYVRPGSAMTAAVFTAKTNYGFPTGYSVTTVSGINGVRTNQTKVTVSGRPTGADVRIEITLAPAVSLYTVSITPGANMTKTSESGAASQTVASGDAITSVVYQASSGYQFPNDYSSLGTTSGVTVTRNSASQITISGTPTATKKITLAEPTAIGATAPTITSQPVSLTLTYGYSSTPLTLSAGEISGHTLSYQWQSSNNGSFWSNINGATSQNYSIPTGYSVSDGIKYYRCRVTATRNDNSQTASTYSNSATVTISPRTATLSWSNTSLTYNGTSQKPTCTVSNLVSGDSCTVTVTGAQTNAGSYTATASGLTGTSSANYQLPSSSTKSFTINKKAITVSGITASDKVYDGGTDAVLVTDGAVFAGMESGDTLTVSCTGTFDDVNVGSGKTVTISGLTLGGSSVGNYQLAASGNQTSTTANITPKTVTVTGGITASDKVYDGNTTATLVTIGATIPDKVSGDNLSVTATGTFADANVGSGKTVTISGLSLGGTDAGNYALATSGNQASTTASITAKEVTVTGITASDKVYDGGTEATLVTDGAVFTGMESGDTLTVSGTGTFDDVNAGSGKTVTISGLTLGGASAGNYSISASSQTSATASVTEKEIGLSWGTSAFIYNGAAQAPEATATGLVGSDTCTVTVDGAEINVGSYTATASALSNANYKLPAAVTQSFTIDPKEVGLSWGASAFTYDGASHLPEATATGLVGSDTCTVTVTGAETNVGSYTATATALSNANYKLPAAVTQGFTIDPKEVGLSWGASAFTYDGASHLPEATATGLAGSDTCMVTVTGAQTAAGSYTATASALSNANYKLPAAVTQSFTIDPREVRVSGIIAVDKYFDNNTSAQLDYSGAVFDGIISGDSLSVTATGAFEKVEVGNWKVTISGLALGGASAANYRLAASGQQTETNARIMQRPESGYDGGSGNGIAERTIYPNAQYSSTDGGSWHQNGTEWTFTFADGRSAAEEWVYATYLGIRNWYYFGGDGRMLTGWLSLGDSMYYLNLVSDGTKGRMVTGWALIGGKWYYFETQAGKNQGRMYRNEMTPDGYRVGADGVWIP